MRLKLLALLIALGLVGGVIGQTALAQGTDGTPDSNPDFSDTVGPNGGWLIIPPPIGLDPNGPPWTKNLLNNPQWSPNGISPSAPPLLVDERIKIGPSSAWTDWHEHIVTPGWLWVDIPTPPTIDVFDGFNLFPAPGLTFSQIPAADIWFNFDPISPGNDVLIKKYIAWVGDGANTLWGDDPNEEIIIIEEFPTVPEPSTFMLLGIGFSSLFGWGFFERRRGRKTTT